MGHKKVRAEKNCLNCGNIVEDRFCPHCGQENLEIHDSAFHLVIHYIQDMFHYDGKFWHTLKILFRKPGQVAVEYMEGERSHNLDPLRFYVFSSTVFFLLLFYMVSTAKWQVDTNPKFNYRKRIYNLEQEKKFIVGTPDTAYILLLKKNIKEKQDSIRRSEGDATGQGMELDLSLPISQDTTDPGWLEVWLTKRAEERNNQLTEKHEGDDAGIFSDIMGEAFHKLPELLFLSLPFFAFFLKLLYFRSKRHRYVEHFIFSIYFYAYLFVIMSIMLILSYSETSSGNVKIKSVVNYLIGALNVYLFIYLMLAMKRYYSDRWRYLIPRYFILIFFEIITLFILFLGILIWTYLV
ncbi:MAG: DUF3667 domain-containing protein [Saprospiraceae bacterium]